MMTVFFLPLTKIHILLLYNQISLVVKLLLNSIANEILQCYSVLMFSYTLTDGRMKKSEMFPFFPPS